ncbi:DUF6286 domain-containing protein [Nocardia sp. CDC153]|uniref:DUF6286 domain-containing protein n=1 Tax=Nocardia sp. CDC153 TaxID=3112167 RepID=UPI002DB97ECC|nr:DUF6286 domain-containing protein [Nocardia sp. CDC153]MEC3953573.1 DUF6286 domain-containing protein [Nocardia sp. CDC153]
MIRRPRRTAPAVVVALAVFALCLVTVISLIQKLTGGRELVSYDSVATRLHGIEWNDAIVPVVGAVVIVLGLLLLGAALLPGRPVVMPLAEVDGSAAGVTRRSVRSTLAREVNGLPGVAARRIRVGRGKIRVSATHADLGPVAADPVPAASGTEDAAAQPLSALAPGGVDARSGGGSHGPARGGADDVVMETVSRVLQRIGLADSRVRTRMRGARRGAAR